MSAVTASRHKDPERHASQVRTANRAYAKAMRRLIEKHRTEYERMVTEELAAEGVVRKGPNRRTTGG